MTHWHFKHHLLLCEIKNGGITIVLFSLCLLWKALLCFSVRISFQEQSQLLMTNSSLRYMSLRHCRLNCDFEVLLGLAGDHMTVWSMSGLAGNPMNVSLSFGDCCSGVYTGWMLFVMFINVCSSRIHWAMSSVFVSTVMLVWRKGNINRTVSVL